MKTVEQVRAEIEALKRLEAIPDDLARASIAEQINALEWVIYDHPTSEYPPPQSSFIGARITSGPNKGKTIGEAMAENMGLKERP